MYGKDWKVGDTVVCDDNTDVENLLKEQETYTIEHIDPPEYLRRGQVYVKGVAGGFWMDRFTNLSR